MLIQKSTGCLEIVNPDGLQQALVCPYCSTSVMRGTWVRCALFQAIGILNREEHGTIQWTQQLPHFGQSVKLGRANNLQVECLICMNGLHGITCENSLSKFFNARFHYHETIVTEEAVAFLDCQFFKAAAQKKDFISVLWRKQCDCTSFVVKYESGKYSVQYATELTELADGQKLVRLYDPSGNLIEVRTPLML